MSVLVTGGAGYIGSHTVIELIGNGYDVVVADNLINSKEESLKRVEKIVGKSIKFYKVDVCDKAALTKVFAAEKIDSVIHFAGLKAVGESVAKPLEYFSNNITGTLVLLEVMREFGVKNIVFSSSATVYGSPKTVPIKEDFELSVTNPYGRTKLFIEQILGDLFVADKTMNIVLLRYFNPVGAHSSGTIGEDPNGIPNNLMPYITQVAIGKLQKLTVHGGDYETHDGTGVRDYIHVVDLAKGHINAVKKAASGSGLVIYNLGTGKGYSVLDMVKAFSAASKKEIPYVIGARRAGDIAACYADPAKAASELGWKAEKSIDEMCADSWRWQQNNPNGYGK